MRKILLKDPSKISEKIKKIKRHTILLEKVNKPIRGKLTVRILLKEWYKELKLLEDQLIKIREWNQKKLKT